MIDTDDVDEVCSYDDLLVHSSASGAVTLACPTCGVLPIPRAGLTLSDLTNAALDHLLEVHADTLTLTSSPRAFAQPPAQFRSRSNLEFDQFTDEDFWSLIGLLGAQGAAGDIEALVRGLASSTEDWILAFHHQLNSAAAALDTPEHAAQDVFDLDGSRPPTPAGSAADVFLDARMAVVAAGRDVWSAVRAEPAQLAGGWPLHAARLILGAPVAAFARVTNRPWQPSEGSSRAVDRARPLTRQP